MRRTISVASSSSFLVARSGRFAASASCRSLATSGVPQPKQDVDWEAMGFNLTKTDFMYVANTPKGSDFSRGEIRKYGPLELEPAATVFSYGQSLFEGLKAFRTANNRIVIFRPTENCKRMNEGAARFLMSPIPEDVFMDGIKETVKANAHYVPPFGKGALYLRPIVFGSGPALGVAPSPVFTFVIYASPVGNYFKGGIRGINLITSEDVHRAAPKGAGSVKAAGNYAPCFQIQQASKKAGYDEVLFLDAKEDKYVEEAGASNFFCVTPDDTIHTPALRGTILPGVTRKSLIHLAREKGIKVNEGSVSIDTVCQAKEAFCSGTGASVTPVASVTYKGNKYLFNNGEVGKVTRDLYDTLVGIQTERVPDNYGWLYDPFADKQ